MDEHEKLSRFEQYILPHLDAAYNLASWLARNKQDAQDVVQEAYLRAFKYFAGFHGGDSRAWLLRIVRNVSYTWLKQNQHLDTTAPFDEEIHTPGVEAGSSDVGVFQEADHESLRQAIDRLPAEYREILILRELEGLSYKEIAEVAALPVGTVMSRLARSRQQLRQSFAQYGGKQG